MSEIKRPVRVTHEWDSGAWAADTVFDADGVRLCTCAIRGLADALAAALNAPGEAPPLSRRPRSPRCVSNVTRL